MTSIFENSAERDALRQDVAVSADHAAQRQAVRGRLPRRRATRRRRAARSSRRSRRPTIGCAGPSARTRWASRRGDRRSATRSGSHGRRLSRPGIQRPGTTNASASRSNGIAGGGFEHMAVVISGVGEWTPPNAISNDELVASYNAYADQATTPSTTPKSRAARSKPNRIRASEFIEKASGIKSRFAYIKDGILDPECMRPRIPRRADDELSHQAEMALHAARSALDRGGQDTGRHRHGDRRVRVHRARLSRDRDRGAGCARHRRLRFRHAGRLLVRDFRHCNARTTRSSRAARAACS